MKSTLVSLLLFSVSTLMATESISIPNNCPVTSSDFLACDSGIKEGMISQNITGIIRTNLDCSILVQVREDFMGDGNFSQTPFFFDSQSYRLEGSKKVIASMGMGEISLQALQNNSYFLKVEVANNQFETYQLNNCINKTML